MLSAIISDSLLFKSPTCIDEDVQAAKELAEIAGVDAERFGLDMLKAGADLSDKSPAELISLDAKEFDMNGNKVEIAQVNTVDVTDVIAIRSEIEPVIEQTVADKGLKLFVFVITDILNNDSVVLAVGEEEQKVAEAFQVTLENKIAKLPGVVSRKKTNCATIKPSILVKKNREKNSLFFMLDERVFLFKTVFAGLEFLQAF